MPLEQREGGQSSERRGQRGKDGTLYKSYWALEVLSIPLDVMETIDGLDRIQSLFSQNPSSHSVQTGKAAASGASRELL